MPYVKEQGWSPYLTFGTWFSPGTHSSSQSVTRLIVSALTNGVGEAVCPGSDLPMDWKWSESYVTLCWVNNLNWRDLMAGSDSLGWGAAFSHESQFLTEFKRLRFCQKWLFSAHHITTDGGHPNGLMWQHQLCPGWAVVALEVSLWKHCSTQRQKVGSGEGTSGQCGSHSNLTCPKGCQPNHCGACRPWRLNDLVFDFLGARRTSNPVAPATILSTQGLPHGINSHCPRVWCYCKLDTIYRSAVAIFGAARMSGRACQPRAITMARTPFLTQLWTISHLTWWASLESTFQIFGKPFSHCPSQSWHFRQHDRKDVMSAAFQVVVTVVSTSSVIFAFLTIPHLEPCHK